MGCLENVVLLGVDESGLGLSWGSPEHEYHIVTLARNSLDHLVSELKPTAFAVAVWLRVRHSEGCVYQENSLVSPVREITMLGDCKVDARILLEPLVDITQTWGKLKLAFLRDAER